MLYLWIAKQNNSHGRAIQSVRPFIHNIQHAAHPSYHFSCNRESQSSTLDLVHHRPTPISARKHLVSFRCRYPRSIILDVERRTGRERWLVRHERHPYLGDPRPADELLALFPPAPAVEGSVLDSIVQKVRYGLRQMPRADFHARQVRIVGLESDRIQFDPRLARYRLGGVHDRPEQAGSSQDGGSRGGRSTTRSLASPRSR